jgi:prepilin-type processing-associated H-X9-DG protein
VPPGGCDGPWTINCCDAESRLGWNWTYYILPYIEQNTLYSNTSDSTHYSTPVATFFCPTRRQPKLYGGVAHTDYAGNGGLQAGDLGKTGVFVRNWTNSPAIPTANPTLQTRKFGDITDGLSNTIAWGEKQLHPSTWGTAGGDNEPAPNNGWDVDVIRFGSTNWSGNVGGLGTDLSHPDSSQPTYWSNLFGSSHTAGVNFVMCDGSVRMISYSVTPQAFQNACTIADGLTVQLD